MFGDDAVVGILRACPNLKELQLDSADLSAAVYPPVLASQLEVFRREGIPKWRGEIPQGIDTARVQRMRHCDLRFTTEDWMKIHQIYAQKIAIVSSTLYVDQTVQLLEAMPDLDYLYLHWDRTITIDDDKWRQICRAARGVTKIEFRIWKGGG